MIDPIIEQQLNTAIGYTITSMRDCVAIFDIASIVRYAYLFTDQMAVYNPRVAVYAEMRLEDAMLAEGGILAKYATDRRAERAKHWRERANAFLNLTLGGRHGTV